MKPLALVFALLLTASTTLLAQTRHVTLALDTMAPRPCPATNDLALAQYETAELVSWPYGLQVGTIDIFKEGASFSVISSGLNTAGGSGQKLVIAGPALIRYRMSDCSKGMVTFKVTPEAFPPDKTFIIPDGTPGATVTLECSTNLLTWTTATNGFYTGTNGAKFFRINAQRNP